MHEDVVARLRCSRWNVLPPPARRVIKEAADAIEDLNAQLAMGEAADASDGAGSEVENQVMMKGADHEDK